MANLEYYRKEKQIWFPDAFQKQLTIEKAEIVFRKLCKHFKLDSNYNQVHLYWVSGNRCPKAIGRYAVKLNRDCNDFGRLCHELAHIKEHQKYGKGGHTKRHKKIMGVMINYCKRRNWFEEELARRTAPKIVIEKPEPSKNEIKQKKIIRLENLIARNTSRIKRSQNAIKKANRKIAYLKKSLLN